MESESRAQGNSSGCPRLSRLTDIRALWHQAEPTSTKAANTIFIRSGYAPQGAHETLICEGWLPQDGLFVALGPLSNIERADRAGSVLIA